MQPCRRRPVRRQCAGAPVRGAVRPGGRIGRRAARRRRPTGAACCSITCGAASASRRTSRPRMAFAHRERPDLRLADVRSVGSGRIAPDVTEVRLRLAGELVDIQVRAEPSAPQWMTCQAAAPSRAIGYQPLSIRWAPDDIRGPSRNRTKHPRIYASPGESGPFHDRVGTRDPGAVSGRARAPSAGCWPDDRSGSTDRPSIRTCSCCCGWSGSPTRPPRRGAHRAGVSTRTSPPRSPAARPCRGAYRGHHHPGGHAPGPAQHPGAALPPRTDLPPDRRCWSSTTAAGGSPEA